MLRGPLAPVRAGLRWIARKTAHWYIREWMTVGFIIQFLILLFAQMFWWVSVLWQPEKRIEPEAQTPVDMSFVEFQQFQDTSDVPQQAQDLSDEIVEKDRIEKKQAINWENAADPAMDFSQRYVPRLSVDVSSNDYPARATRAGIGKVTAMVDIYIGGDGKVKDVRIRRLSSAGDAHLAFQADFETSVRKIILQKTKLLNTPYTVGGQARDFVWQTRITFTL